MRWEQRVVHSARSDVGLRRKNNEDAFVSQPATESDEWEKHGHVFIVADGMGGHAVGELASKIAVETVSHILLKERLAPPDALRKSIVTANDTIYDRGKHNRDFERMGTTCTALSLSPHGAYIGHVGDSRAYRIRRDRVDQLTFDHSLEWEYRTRFPNKKDDSFLRAHKNVITRSLGPEEVVKVDVEGPFAVLPGDRYLLCSDGLTGLVTDEEIGSVVRLLQPDAATRLLIDLANLRGGNDNCTVIVVEVGDLPPGVDPQTMPVERSGPSWNLGLHWLAGFFAVVCFMTIGFGLWIAGRPMPGAVLIGLAGGALIPLIVGTMRSREHQLRGYESDDGDASRTIHNRPHATAVALSPSDLVAQLGTASSDVARTAKEDNWPVDWTKYQEAVESAVKAVEEKRLAAAVDRYGAAIHLVMRALSEVRGGGS